MQEFQHLKLTHKFVKSKIAAIANLNPTNKLTHVQKKRHILTWPLPQQNLQQSSFYICQRTNKGEVFVASLFFCHPKTPTADRVSRSRADMISISVKPLFFKLWTPSMAKWNTEFVFIKSEPSPLAPPISQPIKLIGSKRQLQTNKTPTKTPTKHLGASHENLQPKTNLWQSLWSLVCNKRCRSCKGKSSTFIELQDTYQSGKIKGAKTAGFSRDLRIPRDFVQSFSSLLGTCPRWHSPLTVPR